MARTQVSAAQAAVAQAEAQLEAARAPRQRPEEIDVLIAQEKAAKAAVEESRLDYERAKTLAAKGTAATSVLDQARAAYDRDTAELEQVRHQIAVARLPARKPDLDKAEQALSQAKASLDEMRLQAEKHTVSAPATGLVQEVYYRPGEVVSAGNPVVALLPPSALKVRFFVPEAVLPNLHTGDKVTITCDGCEPTTATIDFLAEEAEYTPPVIYSLEERAKLVFRVEAVPDQPEGAARRPAGDRGTGGGIVRNASILPSAHPPLAPLSPLAGEMSRLRVTKGGGAACAELAAYPPLSAPPTSPPQGGRGEQAAPARTRLLVLVMPQFVRGKGHDRQP